MRIEHFAICLIVAATLAGCGGREHPASTAAADESPTSAATAAKSSSPAAGSSSTEAAKSAGSVAFEVDGKAKRFDNLVPTENYYTPAASQIKAKSTSSGAQLRITFFSMDLKKLSYPVDLPQPRNVHKPMDPASLMASVGFSYVDDQGREWAGPGKIHIESLGPDGTIEATFDGVSIPHTEEKRPNIVLDHGTVHAKIRSFS